MERDGGRDRLAAAASPPPPPPPSPPSASTYRSPSSPSFAGRGGGGARPSPLDVAPHETTIGKYIARFRNDKPQPREARAAVSGRDFWWKLSPRYKRRVQSPGSVASSTPERSRASIFDFDADEEKDKEADGGRAYHNRQDKENAWSESNMTDRHSKDRSSNDERRADNVLYQSLDELERRVRQELGEFPSAAPSLSSSWSSSNSLMEETGAPGCAAESVTEDPEVVIDRVRRRLGWRSASYSIRNVPPQRAAPSRPADYPGDSPAAVSGVSSPLYASSASRSSHESEFAFSSRSHRLDLELPVVLSTATGHEIGEEAAASPAAASVFSDLALSLLGSPSAASSAPSSTIGRTPYESNPKLGTGNDAVTDSATARLESLSLQLDSVIGTLSPGSISAPPSPVVTEQKQTPDSRSQFSLSDSVSDLRFHGDRSPDTPTSGNTSAEQDGDKRPEESGFNDALETKEQTSGAPDAATPTASVTELDDTLRTPRESTPPRATPSLPPTRLRLSSEMSSASDSSPIEAKLPKGQDDSPHSAAEQVFNTLVGFVVHSWSEDEQSDDDAKGEKHSPIGVAGTPPTSHTVRPAGREQAARVSDEEQHEMTKSEAENEEQSALVSPAGSVLTASSKANADETGQTRVDVAFDATSDVDDDIPFDHEEDYAQENESDEMALLLIARIAVFKEALHRLQDQEAHDTTA